jgi:hypothetical protein
MSTFGGNAKTGDADASVLVKLSDRCSQKIIPIDDNVLYNFKSPITISNSTHSQ